MENLKELNNLKNSTLECTMCNIKFTNKQISIKYLEKNITKYKKCKKCRKIKNCKNCNDLFYHKQNMTCSKYCAKQLKKKTYLLTQGAEHNLSRNAKSRIKMHKNLNKKYGITNVFQRKDVKNKIKKTVNKKYGVDNISQCDHIKQIKIDKHNDKKLKNPNYTIELYYKTRKTMIKKYGYDPRVVFPLGKASKESLQVFIPLYEWILKYKISEDNSIFFGNKNKKEYFINTSKRYFLYDFTILDLKLIIEFNGIAWHYNENIHSSNWKSPYGQSKKDNVEKFKNKINTAKEKNFKVLVIWSNISPKENLKICKNFINENKISKNKQVKNS